MSGISRAVVGLPVGAVAYSAQNAVPFGWLVRDGSAVSRTAYPALFAAISTTYNKGGEAGTDFRLPDGRGEFDRGHDGGRGVDSGRVFGSAQGDELKAHAHNIAGTVNGAYNTGTNWQGAGIDNTLSGSAGGTETRPRNVAYLPIIKYL